MSAPNGDLRPGQVAVVTGAARGGGRGVALALAARGLHLALVARSTEAAPNRRLPGTLERVAQEVAAFGVQVVSIPADLSRQETCDGVVNDVLGRFGRCDVLVNNAAYNPLGAFGAMSMRAWHAAMAVNAEAPAVLSRGFLAGMLDRGFGRIVNIGSAAAVSEFIPQLAYSTSKAALERFTVGLAHELRGSAVSVNCLRVDELLRSEAMEVLLPDQMAERGYSSEEFGHAVVWMADRPADVSGEVLTFADLRRLGGIGAPLEHRQVGR